MYVLRRYNDFSRDVIMYLDAENFFYSSRDGIHLKQEKETYSSIGTTILKQPPFSFNRIFNSKLLG